MYDFVTSFGMHGICMWFLGYVLSLAWKIAWIDSGFNLASPFLDSHGMMGFFHLVELWIVGWFWN